ncbi:hypothetical protein F4803DRAFT_426709 [Xylaria telfairii]|nr:hypothetical protein F4803DRAFT_426709 [Xylaria telfairii]
MITHREIEGSLDEVTEREFSWTSSSDESSDTPEGLVETRREQIIKKITLAITQWLRYQFTRAHTAANEATAGPCNDRTTSSSSSDGSCNDGTTSSSSSAQCPEDQVQRVAKRNRDNIEKDELEDDDNDDGANDTKGKGKDIMRFACPYFKYNPTKYKQWPICPGPGWLDIHRVKEHLYRKHRQPRFRCVRCWERFDSEQSHVEHQRAVVPCKLGERGPVEGFDAYQESQLRSRKKKSHIMSEIDRWNTVYQILFPHVSSDKIPSPFYDEYETHTHEALTECEEYVLREIPLRLREILVPEFDRDFQIIEQSLQSRAIESTRTIVASLFQEFRNLHQQGTTTIATPMPGGSQDHAGSSLSQSQPSWPDPIESSSIFQNLSGFDFDFIFAGDGGLSVFGDVQLQDIPEAPTDPENCALKQSDSGYESNNADAPYIIPE